MFSRYSTRTKTNSGFSTQLMLLVSYALVPRKCSRNQFIPRANGSPQTNIMRFGFLENFERLINAVDITIPLFLS